MTAMHRRAPIAALVLCAALACGLPTAAMADTGSISGTVTDAPTGEPIEGAEVCAELFDSEEGVEACGYTETDGTYFIGGLDPQNYRVRFWGSGLYVFEYYDSKRNWEEADPVAVPSGGQAGGVDADLDRTARIGGTVRASEDGLGVGGIEVCAYPLSPEEENFSRCNESDGDGSYSVGGLAPGNYKVEFWTGWSSRNLAYQFWDHESRYAEADVITLDEGEWLEDVDADLQPGGTITGKVSDLGGGAPPEIRVCAIDAVNDALTVCTWSDETGGYRMETLPAGTFKVVFSLEFSEFFPDAFPGEDDDGLPTQFWDHQGSISAANLISLPTGGVAAGIDASFGAPRITPPVTVPSTNPPVRKKRKCRRGYKKKLVKGKRRCVKVRKHRRHRHKRHTGTTAQRFFAR